MSIRLIGGAIIIVALTTSAGAQSRVAGRWHGVTAHGSQIELALAVKGAVLSGTLTRNGETSPIESGKISKDSISFRVLLGGIMESLTGVERNGELKLRLDRQGAANAVAFKRVPSAFLAPAPSMAIYSRGR